MIVSCQRQSRCNIDFTARVWCVVMRNIRSVLSWARWGTAVMTRFLTMRSTISITLSCCWLLMPSLRPSYYRVFRTWTSLWWPWGAGLPWACSQSPSMIGREVPLSLAFAVHSPERQTMLYLGRSSENDFEGHLCHRLLTDCRARMGVQVALHATPWKALSSSTRVFAAMALKLALPVLLRTLTWPRPVG